MRRLALAALWLALLAGPAGGAEPPWRWLRFERQSPWGAATADIGLRPVAAGGWQLTVSSQLGERNSERITLRLASLQGAIEARQRHSRGRRQQRFKAFDYSGEAILRERREPGAGEDELAPARWRRGELRRIPLPSLPRGAVLTAPSALLLLACDPLLADAGAERTVFVHTDYNFYRVTLVNRGERELPARFELAAGGASSSRGGPAVAAHRIELLVSPLSEPERPDFALLGLSGSVALLVARDSRLPLRVTGSAPWLGEVHIDLRSARL